MQGEFQVADLLCYLHQEMGYKKGKGKKSTLPVKFYQEVEADDMEDKCSTVSNEAPILFLFFTSSGAFDQAIVGGDRSLIYLQANDVVRALIGYISVFFVFHIGIHREAGQIVGFLQQILIGKVYDGSKSNGFVHMLDKFEKAYAAVSESKKYKKFCVS